MGRARWWADELLGLWPRVSDLRGILLVVAVESFILMPSTDFTHTALSHSRVKFLSAAYFTFVITAGLELDLSQDQTVFAGCAGAVRVNVMHMMHRAASAREGEKSPKDFSSDASLPLPLSFCYSQCAPALGWKQWRHYSFTRFIYRRGGCGGKISDDCCVKIWNKRRKDARRVLSEDGGP